MIEILEVVRFVADSRNGDWKRGDTGIVTRVLALPPQNQSTIYIVNLEAGDVWATNKDIEPMRQMTIFDVLPTASEASDRA